MTLTKDKIEELGNKVVEICKANDWGDTCVYFNGKRVSVGYGKMIFDENGCHFTDNKLTVEENCHPNDYFEYYNSNHILSMSFEGPLYDLLNYDDCPGELRSLFNAYGVYYELGNMWNLSVYPINDDMEVEGIRY